MRRHGFLGLLCGIILSRSLAIAALTDTTAPALNEELVKDLTYLASDDLEGRGLGSPGLDKAADYIATRFKSLGLRTVPDCPDYFEPFPASTAATIKSDSALRGGELKFRLMEQFIPQGFSPNGDFSGPVAFAGYGITDAAHNYDDYAGLDVKGKVVLVLRYEPHDDQGNSRFTNDDWSSVAALTAKAESAAAHGAVALLLVNPPNDKEPDQLLPVTRAMGKSSIPFIHIKQEVADDLLRRGKAGQTLGQLEHEIDSTLKPRSLDLATVTVSGKVSLQNNLTQAKNVLAYLPGGKSPDQFIVVGAHYDHLGHGGPGSLAPRSHEIHHGADDNASGTTAVMNLAERFVYAGRRDRSILFVLFSGEEEGLLGSDYFVNHSPIPLNKIVAMVNLDMVGRVRNETLYVGGGGTADAFDAILNDADLASPLQLKSIGQGGRGPSDHQSFSMKNIPVIFFFSGLHSDYHRPTDVADKINYQGISEVVRLSMDVVDSLTTMPPQQYVGKYDAEPSVLVSATGAAGTRTALGVVPDYGTDETTAGVKITGTSPGSPAANAGLLDGDVIIQIADKKIENLYDLSNFLNAAHPGDRVSIVLMRHNQRIEVTTTLAQKQG